MFLFFCPRLLKCEVSALTTLSGLSAFSLVILVGSVKLSFGSSVTPSFLGFLTVGSVVHSEV